MVSFYYTPYFDSIGNDITHITIMIFSNNDFFYHNTTIARTKLERRKLNSAESDRPQTTY